MKFIKIGVGIICAIIVLLVFLDKKLEQDDSNILQSDPHAVHVKKRFGKDGKLIADAEIVDKRRNGIAHNYYSNGKIHSEIHYKEDLKHGTSTWFYENGKVYRVTNYIDGRKSGIQQKFYKNGRLMAEIPFEADVVQEGTTEYWENGERIMKYPELKVENNNGIYTVYLSPKVKKAKYFAFVNTGQHQKKIKAQQTGKVFVFDLQKHPQDSVLLCVEFRTDLGSPLLFKKNISALEK